MANKTNKQKERILNELYQSAFTEDQVVNDLTYITVKGRQGGHTTVNNIRNHYRSGTIGKLIRKFDSIRFHTD